MARLAVLRPYQPVRPLALISTFVLYNLFSLFFSLLYFSELFPQITALRYHRLSSPVCFSIRVLNTAGGYSITRVARIRTPKIRKRNKHLEGGHLKTRILPCFYPRSTYVNVFEEHFFASSRFSFGTQAFLIFPTLFEPFTLLRIHKQAFRLEFDNLVGGNQSQNGYHHHQYFPPCFKPCYEP